MYKRIRIILIVGLVLSLFASSAIFADFSDYYSIARMDIGVTSTVKGGVQNLGNVELSGSVSSYDSSTGLPNERMTGWMKTKGLVFTHTRDTVDVSPWNYSFLYWANSSAETGTFWSEVRAPYGNHNGHCQVWQTY